MKTNGRGAMKKRMPMAVYILIAMAVASFTVVGLNWHLDERV